MSAGEFDGKLGSSRETRAAASAGSLLDQAFCMRLVAWMRSGGQTSSGINGAALLYAVEADF
jgi:hypothetical protein